MRTDFITFRVSTEEKNQLKSAAEKANFSSLSGFIFSIFKKYIKKNQNLVDAEPAKKEEIPLDNV